MKLCHYFEDHLKAFQKCAISSDGKSLPLSGLKLSVHYVYETEIF